MFCNRSNDEAALIVAGRWAGAIHQYIRDNQDDMSNGTLVPVLDLLDDLGCPLEDFGPSRDYVNQG